MEELARVEKDLHKAQDLIAYLEPPAKLVIELRERQRAWDEAAAGAGGSGGASGGGGGGSSGGGGILTPFTRGSTAVRARGPRPTLTL